MTREEQLRFCKVCEHKFFDRQQGLLCSLTDEKANFEEDCMDFKGNRDEVVVPEIVESKTDVLLARLLDFLSAFNPRAGFFMSPILIMLCVLIFAVMVISGVHFFNPTADSLVFWGANYTTFTLGGDYWRLISNCFLHIGIIHLLMNMCAFYYIGKLLEPVIGKWKTGLAFIITGIAASLTSLMWHDMIVSAGASGAIFGLYGVYIAMLLSNLLDKSSKKGTLISILFFVGYNLLYGLKGGIDNAAHVGGLFSGILFGFSLYPSLSSPKEKVKAWLIPIVSLVFIMTCGILVLKAPNNIVRYEKKFAKFVDLESKALSVYPNSLENFSLDAFKKDGIPNWKKCQSILSEIDNLSHLPEELYTRNVFLARYCKYRIACYGLMEKAIEENTPKYARQIEQYNMILALLVRRIQGEDIASNLLIYKAPVERKSFKVGPRKVSIQKKARLYIIDGEFASDISEIKPDDIKSLDFMEGAAAKAVYGEKGKDGVFIVTTK